MSGPIIRKYGFPNFEKIFGDREIKHGAEPPKADAEPEAIRPAEPDRADAAGGPAKPADPRVPGDVP